MPDLSKYLQGIDKTLFAKMLAIVINNPENIHHDTLAAALIKTGSFEDQTLYSFWKQFFLTSPGCDVSKLIVDLAKKEHPTLSTEELIKRVVGKTIGTKNRDQKVSLLLSLFPKEWKENPSSLGKKTDPLIFMFTYSQDEEVLQKIWNYVSNPQEDSGINTDYLLSASNFNRREDNVAKTFRTSNSIENLGLFQQFMNFWKK
jgi:hypothetical protein